MSALPDVPTSLYRPHAEAPARLSSLREATDGEGRSECFEVVSRGDFVPGRLHRPTSVGPHPLVLVLGGSAAWDRGVEQGLAVARIDLPLLGARQSPKLTDRLVGGHACLIRDEPLDPDTHALFEEFARQSVSDVVRSLEALAADAGVDGSRIALVGAGIGASVCAWALPFAPALHACVLAGPVGAFADERLDPAARIGTAGLGDVRCRLYATAGGPSEAAVGALAERLPGRPTPETLNAPVDAAAWAENERESILDFVARSLAG